MISSRTADWPPNHAMSRGVNMSLGKPYDEAELLAQVAGFTEKGRRVAVA